MRRSLKCVYCAEVATTNDHVIARCLLEKPYPPDLKTVPSCRACNAAYKADEEYLLAIMAQAGFVPSLMSKVEKDGIVDRMLQGSSGLDARIINSLRVADDGRVYMTPEEVRIANVARKVAFGLYCHRYTPKKLPSLADFFALEPLHNEDDKNFIVVLAHTERFQPRRWIHVQTIKPPGSRPIQVFDYMFVRNWYLRDFERLFCVMRFHETIWAAVRCPEPPNRKHPKCRVEHRYDGRQEPL
ncbi:MAG: hypothetical protein IT364_05360 [Candidatus Hydrogenedentes bacterium]|nr:hypothetical protein [Candidatus Hydrogenedentota bacterium]